MQTRFLRYGGRSEECKQGDCCRTFHTPERLRRAELAGVGGQAAHQRAAAGVVEAARLGVVLRRRACRLGPRGHGVGRRVHVALLLDQAVLLVGQGLCWRGNDKTPVQAAAFCRHG